MSRHLIIPDAQCKPGVPLSHIDHAAQAIVDYRPDTVVVLGDWWDMPSLSKHETPGSEQMEGTRYEDDVAAGNEAFERLVRPLRGLRRKPERHFLFGNHEHRITRALSEKPQLQGALSLDDLDTQGFERHAFLDPLWLDGIVYAHYFTSSHSARPLGGSIDSMLNRIGDSFVQGHVQGFKYGNRMYPTGRIRHGLVAGSFYQHDEHYRGPQGRTQHHWNGIVVLNDVRDGNYEIMPLSLEYLRRRYGGRKCSARDSGRRSTSS